MANFFTLVTVTLVLSVSNAHDEHNNCINGGRQMADGSCFCPSHFFGSRCQTLSCPEEDQDECGAYKKGHCLFNHIKKNVCPYKCGVCPSSCKKLCFNGGEVNTFSCTCDCPLGYSGESCEVRDCSYQTCQNGGIVNPTTCGCICPANGVFSGKHCDKVDCSTCRTDPPSCDPAAKCLICNNKLLAFTCPHLCDLCDPKLYLWPGTTTPSPVCECSCVRESTSASTTTVTTPTTDTTPTKTTPPTTATTPTTASTKVPTPPKTTAVIRT